MTETPYSNNNAADRLHNWLIVAADDLLTVSIAVLFDRMTVARMDMMTARP